MRKLDGKPKAELCYFLPHSILLRYVFDMTKKVVQNTNRILIIFAGNSATLDQRQRISGSGGFRRSEEIDEHTTSYYGGEIYNGSLYVVNSTEESFRSNDNYGYLPTPPPPPPPINASTSRYLYPEHAGHLV